ncbi:MAG: trypsin-like peptidase domain-containing protein [Christensenellaceae bacterium]|nr:trypsin-like peptidase domain-containing protein [Christensenellaceae bacterium]
MYNDNYDYNMHGDHSEPPRKKRPRRGKGWLIVMVIVAAVVIVSCVSIEGYKLVENFMAKEEETPLEWTTEEKEPTAAEEKAPAVKEEKDSAPEMEAKEGTSAGYALENKPSSGLLDQAPESIAAEVTPSVVCIQNYVSVTYQTSQGGFFRGFNGLNYQEPEFATEIRLNGEGSGIILTEDGYISTNAHVVSGADLIKVVLSDDTLYEAKLIGIDMDTDLAVIKIDAQGLTPAELGNSDELNVGQYVMAIGNPGGLEFSSTVTLGIVSAVNRPLQLEENGYSMNTIQTDAAINPGNSGGALVNMNGQVIGINSAKYAATGYEGLGFAISINEALPIIKDLMDYGKVMGRSMLGVSGIMLDDLTAEHYDLVEGFYIYELENPDAGTLRAGDIITKINDTKVTADNVIKNALKDIKPGENITVEYYRSQDGSTGTTTLTLMEFDDTVG